MQPYRRPGRADDVHRLDFYRHAHPTPPAVLLLIEVADTTVEYDREIKMPLYARAGIAEAWLVDLPGAAIEAYRSPGEDGYADRRTYKRGETLSAMQLPGLILAVSDVLG